MSFYFHHYASLFFSLNIYLPCPQLPCLTMSFAFPTLQIPIFLSATIILCVNPPPPPHLLYLLPSKHFPTREMTASLLSLSTLRVFNERDSRFILNATFQDLDWVLAATDFFISPLDYELPLAIPWFHIHKCPSELSTKPSHSDPYIQ